MTTLGVLVWICAGVIALAGVILGLTFYFKSVGKDKGWGWSFVTGRVTGPVFLLIVLPGALIALHYFGLSMIHLFWIIPASLIILVFVTAPIAYFVCKQKK
jgi:hypothetical protein